MHAKGHFQIPAQGIGGDLEILSARPARLVWRATVPGIGVLATGYDGHTAWLVNPISGPEVFSGRMLSEAADDAWFDQSSVGDRVRDATTLEKTEFDKRPAFKVHVVFTSGNEETQYFDAESGLQIGSEATRAMPQGVVSIVNTRRNYQKFGDLLQPTVFVQSRSWVRSGCDGDVDRLQRRVRQRVRPAGRDQSTRQAVSRSSLRAIALSLSALVGATIPVAVAPLRQDDNWRAAALQSFDDVWQTVNDTFYDPSFKGLDWAAVRAEFRPRAVAAESLEINRRVIRQMLARLGESHFELLPGSPDSETLPGDARVPIDIRIAPAGVIVTRVDVKSSAERAGVRPGDRILAIDGTDASEWLVPGGPDARANQLESWKRAFRALHGTTGSIAHLSIARGAGAPFGVDVARAGDTGQVVTLGNLPPLHVRTTAAEVRTPGHRRVGVIGFNVWMVAVADPFAAAIDKYRGDDGLVIDLRGNPGGLAEMIRGIAGYVVDKPVLLGRMHLRSADLEFRANPRLSTSDGRRVRPFSGPVAILVDELTASASECFTGGLQSLGRARVFGAQTMGEALPASTKALPDGDVLLYAIGDFVTSTDQRLEGAGVMPDEVVPLDPAALGAGHDRPLEAALGWIDGQGK